MTKADDPHELDPVRRGVPQAGIRIANERAVLSLIGLQPGSSNADVARLSGLGPQTTSRIIAELDARGLIVRGDLLRGRRGQPATPLSVNPEGAYAIGVEIGWRHMQVTLLNLTARVLAHERREYAFPDATTVFAEIAERVAGLLAGLSPQQRSRLVGIGVASPASIGLNTTVFVDHPEQPALWRAIDIAERVAADTGLPTEWFNDGTAACWAELIAMSQARPLGFAYFHVGAYIGAGIYSGGRLWDGPTGNAANLGGIMVSDRHGAPAFLHYVASISAFENWLREAGRTPPSGSPQDWNWEELEPHASAWLDDAGRALAQAAMTTQAMIEFDHATIDGSMPRLMVERLLERVQHHLALLPVLSAGRPTVTMGHQGALAAVNGAAFLPIFKRYYSRSWDHFGT